MKSGVWDDPFQQSPKKDDPFSQSPKKDDPFPQSLGRESTGFFFIHPQKQAVVSLFLDFWGPPKIRRNLPKQKHY